MTKKVLAFAEQYHMLEQGSHILAGVSGGADSVCLLLMLCAFRERYNLTVSAVHVEHGIRGEESLRDAAFTEELCRRLGVECRMLHKDAVAFSREQGMSLEEGARVLRYNCFEQVRGELGADKIAVAHNQNDCAETLLFHLIRGTGLRGMCGIVPVRGRIIRPLLCVSRSEIEGFLAERGQEYCMDATNLELCYTRNKIRRLVLPVLSEINAGAVEHLYQSTRYAAEAFELMEELVAAAKKRCVREEANLQKAEGFMENGRSLILLKCILEEPLLVQKSLILELLAECAASRRDITAVHVDKVQELFRRQAGRRLELPYGVQALRTYEGIILRKQGEAVPFPPRQITPGKATPFPPRQITPGETVSFPSGGLHMATRILEKTAEIQEIPKKTYTKWFDYDRIKDTLWLRTREKEDFFVMDSLGRRQSLRRYFINEKVPAGERDFVPVLAEGNHILWAFGYRISEAYKVTKETKRILEVQVYGGNIHE